MTQTPHDLDRLGALAEAATKGEWGVSNNGIEIVCGPLLIADWASGADALYIAAAQPSTVIWMIERIRELEEEVGTLDQEAKGWVDANRDL